jgi:hypothetical protein
MVLSFDVAAAYAGIPLPSTGKWAGRISTNDASLVLRGWVL